MNSSLGFHAEHAGESKLKFRYQPAPTKTVKPSTAPYAPQQSSNLSFKNSASVSGSTIGDYSTRPKKGYRTIQKVQPSDRDPPALNNYTVNNNGLQRKRGGRRMRESEMFANPREEYIEEPPQFEEPEQVEEEMPPEPQYQPRRVRKPPVIVRRNDLDGQPDNDQLQMELNREVRARKEMEIQLRAITDEISGLRKEFRGEDTSSEQLLKDLRDVQDTWVDNFQNFEKKIQKEMDNLRKEFLESSKPQTETEPTVEVITEDS